MGPETTHNWYIRHISPGKPTMPLRLPTDWYIRHISPGLPTRALRLLILWCIRPISLTVSASLYIMALDDLDVELIDVVCRSLCSSLIHHLQCLLSCPLVCVYVTQGFGTLLSNRFQLFLITPILIFVR